MQTTRAKHVTLAFAAIALAGCASVQTPTLGDPLERFNRGVFGFNETVDKYALKPVAKGYQWAVPEPVRKGVTNIFSNIGDVYIAANELLQLKIADGVGDIMRVAINTLFGVGGIFDVASAAQLPKHDSDFGITLGHYGVPAGPYLVLPIFGPSTVRDAGALVVDYYGNPLTYIGSSSVSWALYGVKLVNTRANLLTTLDVLSGAALDKYSFLRNTYLQRRRYLISGAGSAQAPNYEQSLPNYEDGTSSGGTHNAAPAPAEAPPAEAPPTEAPPTEAPPTEAAPTSPASGTTVPASPGGASDQTAPGRQ